MKQLVILLFTMCLLTSSANAQYGGVGSPLGEQKGGGQTYYSNPGPANNHTSSPSMWGGIWAGIKSLFSGNSANADTSVSKTTPPQDHGALGHI